MTTGFHRRARCAVLLGLVLVALAGCGTAPPRPVASLPVETPPGEPEPAPRPAGEPFTLTVNAVGDIMLGTDYPENLLPPDDGVGMLAAVTPWLRDADVVFGNLEGGLLDGGKAFKTCAPNSACYVFRTPARYVEHLTRAGITVVSVANNHARDFGEAGRSATLATLDQAGIRYSGREGEYARWQVKGKRIALVAFAPYSGSNHLLDLPKATATVAQLAAENDFVLVSFHGGAEGSTATRVPFANEIFHGEERGDVAAFGRAMVDAGAALVIGHGPHVPRALELYKDRLIAYSLGNFATYQGVNVRGVNGLAPVLHVELAADGRFVGGAIRSARQIRPGGPIPDATHEAARVMAELTRADFPATPLQIDAEGTITRAPLTAP